MVTGSESAGALAAREGLAAARRPQAVRPGPEPEALREAYLELLKLCLCDLTAASTISVGRTEDGLVASRELIGEQLRVRAAGMDWPLQGLTMVGLRRLDDLQKCVQSVIRDRVEGDLIEAGTWRGGAAILMRATLDSLGAHDRTVWVADSFQGFPRFDSAEGSSDQWGGIDYLAVPLDVVRANFGRLGLESGVRFVSGFFAQTLPALAGERWSVVRLDGDTYEATWTALEALYPGLSLGGYLIVDDYGALEECRRAVDEFRVARGVKEPLEQVDWTCVRWRRQSAPQPVSASAASSTRDATESAALSLASRQPQRVPTLDELALRRELAAVRRRLASVEAEVERMRSAPLAGLRAWLRVKREQWSAR